MILCDSNFRLSHRLRLHRRLNFSIHLRVSLRVIFSVSLAYIPASVSVSAYGSASVSISASVPASVSASATSSWPESPASPPSPSPSRPPDHKPYKFKKEFPTTQHLPERNPPAQHQRRGKAHPPPRHRREGQSQTVNQRRRDSPQHGMPSPTRWTPRRQNGIIRSTEGTVLQMVASRADIWKRSYLPVAERMASIWSLIRLRNTTGSAIFVKRFVAPPVVAARVP